MGTKVHFRSCFPGHDKMRDLNVDADNTWPSFYISKTLSGNLYNGCFLSPSTGYSEYDKEMLKRTMLEHEAVFRKQVYELHRLYGIQKDLMEELQKNDLSAFSEYKSPSNTISRSSQVLSDFTTRMKQTSHLCAMNNYPKREKPSYNNNIIYPVNFPESNLQSSSGFIETETLQRVAESDGSFRNCHKRMLDFRLPAGAYIDSIEKSEEIPGSSSVSTSTCSRVCIGDSVIEFNLNSVNVSGSSGKEDSKLSYLYKKSLFPGLVDSNEPNRQASLEGAPNSFPVMEFGSESQIEKNHRFNFPLSSTTLNLQIALTNDEDCGERTFSNVFQGAKEEISRGAVCYDEPGKLFPVNFMNSTLHKEKDPILCEPVMLNVSKVSDIISIDHNEASTRLGHEQSNSFLKSGECNGHSESGNFGKLTSVLSNSFSSSFKLESNMTSLSPVQTLMKLSSDENLASSPFLAISNFDGSSGMKKICCSDIATKDPNGALGSCQIGFDLKSPVRFEENCSSHLNGLKDEHEMQAHSMLQEKFPPTNINLNVEAENSISETLVGPTIRQNKPTNVTDGKCEDFLPGLSWLNRRPACESLEPSGVPSQVDLEFIKMNQDVISFPSCNYDACSSSPHKRESKISYNQQSDSLSSMKFIASNFDKLRQNLISSSNEEKLVMDELKHVSMSHDMKMCSSKKSTSSENNRRNTRNCIDLNSLFPFEDDPDSSESSLKAQADSPSIHSEPILVSRIVPLIDLEAPVMILDEDNITSDIASTPLSRRDGLQEELCSSEIIIKQTAENIVKLSLDGFKLKDEIQVSLSSTPPANALYTFAEIILSSNNIIDFNAASDCHLQHRDDAFDLFELMTLQLEEIKPENFCCRFQEAENAKENQRSKASLLLIKPRRVQGKKRRQKKNFQKDILPALATLSRQESMKDLQAIGKLMKVSDMPWQAGIRRRNIRGNGAQAQAIQKLRRRNAVVCVSNLEINPPTALFMVDGNNCNAESEVNRHHMIGWGRTTRRCRTQRCPSVCISSTLM